MIQATNVTMRFNDFTALNKLTCTIPDGCIYGLIGSNGAGKSTFLRLIAGVYRPAEGEITIDGMPVWENPAAKASIVYVPDNLYFLPQCTAWRTTTSPSTPTSLWSGFLTSPPPSSWTPPPI